jgi:hypothetical protein
MRTGFACVALALLCVCSRGGQAPILRLPEPPRQHAAWRADTTVPANLLSAVETLFEQGFPDPRGCEYREIEVEVSGVWSSKSALVKTRGWVLPSTGGKS